MDYFFIFKHDFAPAHELVGTNLVLKTIRVKGLDIQETYINLKISENVWDYMV